MDTRIFDYPAWVTAARLWFGKIALPTYNLNEIRIETLQKQNANLKQRNALLKLNISDLQLGLESIEEPSTQTN